MKTTYGHVWLLGTALSLTGCPTEKPEQQPAASLSSSPTPTPVTRSAPSARPDDGSLKAAKAKSYAFTESQALGTLPEGVGIAVGQTAPDFELPAHARGNFSLDALLVKGEVLLVFYRGGW